MVRCYLAGYTFARIADTVGLSRARVRQIVKASGVPMPQDYKCAVKDCDTAPRSPNSYCWRHKEGFEHFGDWSGTRRVVNSQHGTMVRYKRDGCRCERCRRRNADRSLEYLHRMHPEMGNHKPHKGSGGMQGRPTPARARLLADRNATIMRMYGAGQTLANIGATLGLTRERVRQIVKNADVPMPRDYTCAVRDCDTAPRSPNAYCSLHQRRFERFGDPLWIKVASCLP